MSTTNSVQRILHAKPRRVDFVSLVSDHECALLAAMGMSTYYIQSITGLSASQITYRIGKAGLTRANGASRQDFRNGTSPFAASAIYAARAIVDHDLVKYLKTHAL